MIIIIFIVTKGQPSPKASIMASPRLGSSLNVTTAQGARNAHASNIARMEYVFCPPTNKISIITLAPAPRRAHIQVCKLHNVLLQIFLTGYERPLIGNNINSKLVVTTIFGRHPLSVQLGVLATGWF